MPNISQRLIDEGITEMAKITVSMSNPDLMKALASRIQDWLLEMVPVEVRMKVNWSIDQSYIVMDLRDRTVRD